MLLRPILFVFLALSHLPSFSQKDKNKIPLFPIFTTFFEIGKSQLTELQMENLRTYVISNIRTIKDSNYCIQVCGHSDASGNKKMNIELSRKRAQSVSDFIIKNGVSEKKIKTECTELIKHENSLSLKTKRKRQNNHLSRSVVVRIDKEN
jgi:hypothetical protein